MAESIATIAQKLEKGYAKMVRFDSDKILYVSGKQKKIGNPLEFPCDTAEELESHANGGKTQFLNLSDITRFRSRSDKKTIDIGFTDDKGRACTIEIDASSRDQKELVLSKFGNQLEQTAGFVKADKQVSAFSLSWGPTLLMLVTVVVGGLLTVSQASGEGIQFDEEHGGGRSARKARAMRGMISGVSNLLGFWGCLIVTLVTLLICGAYLFKRLKNRPIVSVWSPS